MILQEVIEIYLQWFSKEFSTIFNKLDFECPELNGIYPTEGNLSITKIHQENIVIICNRAMYCFLLCLLCWDCSHRGIAVCEINITRFVIRIWFHLTLELSRGLHFRPGCFFLSIRRGVILCINDIWNNRRNSYQRERNYRWNNRRDRYQQRERATKPWVLVNYGM